MGVYNGAEFLRDAVESILDQTLGDFEFIIINDGSTDDSMSILREFSDARLRIYENQENEGLTCCLIKGCNEARGEYIARMDADDISCPQRLEKQVDFLDANPDYGAVGCGCYFIDSEQNTFGEILYALEHEEILGLMETKNPMVHGSTMFRSKTYHDIGGYREFFQHTQDYDLWLRFCEKTRMANLPDFLYKHRHHDARVFVTNLKSQYMFSNLARKFAEMRSKSGQDPLMMKDYDEIERIIQEMSPKGFLAEYRNLSNYYAEAAQGLYHLGLRLVHLRGVLLYSFLYNPFNKKVWRIILSSEFKTRIRKSLRYRIFRTQKKTVKK